MTGKRVRHQWLVALLLGMLTLTGCSTSQIGKARLQYASGNADAALATLGNGEDIRARDRLLYLMEKGLILHETGNYEASSRELLAAADFIGSGTAISLSGEATALLANDWARNYRGEYSEQLWVHSYLMMNFLALGQYDSAAVEARRALQKIDDREKLLKFDQFTRALMAVSFEAAGQANSAYIEYRKLAEVIPDPQQLYPRLLSYARLLGFTDAAKQYRLDDGRSAVNRSDAELVVFLASGHIPTKVSGSLYIDNNARVSFPRYLPGESRFFRPQISIDGNFCDCLLVTSSTGQLARESLDSRGASVTARLVARAVAKDAFADSIGSRDEVAGEIVKLLLFALEEADTRGWHSLPGHLSLLRIPLAEGSSRVVIGDPAAPLLDVDVSDMQRGQKRFIPLRIGGI